MKEALPSFSVVVPTYRRPDKLAACLQALCAVDYPAARFEVIVVDDGSPTSMQSVVAPFRERMTVSLLRQENAGPATARNAGAAAASGSFLAFTDDDCLPDSSWLSEFGKGFAAAPEAMLGGQTINVLADNRFSTASQELISYLYAYYAHAYGQPHFFTSNNLALPARRFRELGGFDAGFARAAGEDRELCDRWLHGGLKMTYAPDAVVRHTHALNGRSFWRQHFNYGRAAVRFYKLRATRDGKPLQSEPLAFYFDMLRYPFSRLPRREALVIAALIGISQVANAAGFCWEKGNPAQRCTAL